MTPAIKAKIYEHLCKKHGVLSVSNKGIITKELKEFIEMFKNNRVRFDLEYKKIQAL